MILLGLLAAAGTGKAATLRWQQSTDFDIDPVHSQVMFKVRHLGVSTVTGEFTDFTGKIHFDPEKPANSFVRVRIDAATVDTHNERRDRDLRSDHFLEVDTYPHIEFASRTVRKEEGGRFTIEGELTIHGITQPVVLQAVLGGVLNDDAGPRVIGFSAETKIDRRDYGLVWNRVLEAGGVLVGNEVRILIEVEGHRAEASD